MLAAVATVGVGVRVIQPVPVLAVRLPAIQRSRALPAASVLKVGDRLQVAGIHAPAVATQMIELQADRDWPSRAFEANAMSLDHAPGDPEMTVPTTVARPQPQPASGGTA